MGSTTCAVSCVVPPKCSARRSTQTTEGRKHTQHTHYARYHSFHQISDDSLSIGRNTQDVGVHGGSRIYSSHPLRKQHNKREQNKRALQRQGQHLNFQFLEVPLRCTSDTSPVHNELQSAVAERWYHRTAGFMCFSRRSYMLPQDTTSNFPPPVALGESSTWLRTKTETTGSTSCVAKVHTPGEGERSRLRSAIAPSPHTQRTCGACSPNAQKLAGARCREQWVSSRTAVCPQNAAQLTSLARREDSQGTAHLWRKSLARDNCIWNYCAEGERGDENRRSRVWQGGKEPV